MGFFVDRRKVYRIEVKSPKDPETGDVQKAWVDLRKMTEGDIQDRQDIATRIRTEQRKKGVQLRGHLKKGGAKRRGQPEEEAQMQYALGELRGFDLVRSIVDWGLVDENGRSVPPTPDNIRSLDPYTAGQIHDEIALRNPSIFPTGEDEEEEEGDAGDGLDRDEEYEGQEYGGPQNADDELYGRDEDAPGEIGGAEEEPEEALDPTKTISGNRQSTG